MIFAAPSDQIAAHAPGYLLVLAIVIPVAGVLISFVLGGRYAERTALFVIALGMGVAFAILYEVYRTGEALTYILGGWQPPLGITLDIVLLHERIRPEPATAVAVALMTAGLLAKTALFPVHFWLPPAHAGAPPAASAILSALVIKGAFFLIVRIWFDVVAEPRSVAAAQILGVMGAAAIIWGSVIAIRQARLKLLIAYSTVAQIGYLFLMFPLVIGSEILPWSNLAWTGGWIQLFSHAFAKAAMFMAAGLIAETLGHDRIADLDGVGRVLPLTVLAFGIAGISLMGVPPSGGFVAKWLLLSASVQEGQWWWALVILAGGLLAGAYVIRVLVRMIADPPKTVEFRPIVSRRREAIPFALAICALLLGLVPLQPSEILQIGRPDIVRSMPL